MCAGEHQSGHTNETNEHGQTENGQVVDGLQTEECDGKIGFRILKSAESHLAIRERILLLSPDGLRRKSPGVRPKTGKPSVGVAIVMA